MKFRCSVGASNTNQSKTMCSQSKLCIFCAQTYDLILIEVQVITITDVRISFMDKTGIVLDMLILVNAADYSIMMALGLNPVVIQSVLSLFYSH